MSVFEGVRTMLGIAREELYHCWDCDATYRPQGSAVECDDCGSADLRAF
jgi:Zn finger protein HypA/HybF involved in hydrogenase expression